MQWLTWKKQVFFFSSPYSKISGTNDRDVLFLPLKAEIDAGHQKRTIYRSAVLRYRKSTKGLRLMGRETEPTKMFLLFKSLWAMAGLPWNGRKFWRLCIPGVRFYGGLHFSLKTISSPLRYQHFIPLFCKQYLPCISGTLLLYFLSFTSTV